MQGRLSQKKNLPLQSFPHDTWREEFYRAKKIGFTRIEWLIDIENDYKNPIFSTSLPGLVGLKCTTSLESGNFNFFDSSKKCEKTALSLALSDAR